MANLKPIQVLVNGEAAGRTINELSNTVRQLQRELNRLPAGSEEFIAKSKQLAEAKKNLNEVRDAAKQVGNELAGIKAQSSGLSFKELANAATIFSGVQLGVQGVFTALKGFAQETVEAGRVYGKSLSELSAITGATGQDLAFLDQQAKSIGQTMKVSASEVVDGFKLMASAKPELLANKEALAALTQEAIVLAKASGMALPDAVNSLASSLNQFGQGADAAGEFINILAAGAKEGAAEIADVNMALKNSGTVAAAAGLSFAQTNAVLQSAATIQLKGSEAGTQLRGVLLKLMSGADETNPKVVGLSKALENLGAKNLSTAEQVKLFGEGNIILGQHLISNAKNVAELEAKISGTDEAYKQASTNTDDLAGDFDALSSAVLSAQLSIADKMDSALRVGVQGLTAFTLGVIELPKFLYDNREAIGALAIAVLSLNAATIKAKATTLAATAVEKARGLATQASTLYQNALNASMAANPIGLVIAGIAGLIAVFVTLYKNSEAVRASIAGLWEMMKTTAQVVGQLVMALAQGDWSAVSKVWETAGDNIAGAFKKGYNERIRSGREAEKAEAAKAAQETAAAEAQAQQEGAKKKIGLIQKAEEQIKLLKDQLAEAETKAEIARISKQIKAAEAAMDELTGKAAQARAEKERKAREERRKAQDEAHKAELEALRKLNKLQADAMVEGYAKKEAQLRAEAEAERRAVNESKATAETKAALIKAINQKLANDLAKAWADFDKEEKAASERAIKSLNELFQRQQLARADAELALAQRRKNQADDRNPFGDPNADQALFQALVSKLETQRDIELENTKLTEDERKAIIARSELDIDNIRRQYTEEKNRRDLDAARFALGTFADIASQFNDFGNISSQRDLARAERDKNRRLTTLESEYKSGRISKEKYEKDKSEIEQGFDERTRIIKRRQAEQNKRWQIAQAIMAGAVAVMSASANPLGIFSPQAIATSIAAALNVGKVIATPVPEFERGGVLPGKGGLPQGSRHSQGGIKLVDGSSGRLVGEIEGGEPILSRSFYANNKNLVDRMLYLSQKQGGARMQLDQNSLFPRYETGGVLPGGPASSGMLSGDSALIQEVQALRQTVARQTEVLASVMANQPTALRAYIVADDLKEGVNTLLETRIEAGTAREIGYVNPEGRVVLDSTLL